MREYKFRGIVVNVNGSIREWVYGSLVMRNGIPHILEDKPDYELNYHQVVISTVGQFTGLHDKNGVEIYEGDIVIHTSFPNDKQEVRFKNGCFVVHQMALYSYHKSVIEVIGNIHKEEGE